MLRIHFKKKKKSKIKPPDTTKSLSALQLGFSTPSPAKDPPWVPSVGEPCRARWTRRLRPGCPYTTCSVWEKSSSISVPNLQSLRGEGRKFCQLLEEKTALNKRESHQLATRGVNASVFFNNAEGFGIKQKRGETPVRQPTNLGASWRAGPSVQSWRRSAGAAHLPLGSTSAPGSQRDFRSFHQLPTPTPLPTRAYIWYLNTEERLGDGGRVGVKYGRNI